MFLSIDPHGSRAWRPWVARIVLCVHFPLYCERACVCVTNWLDVSSIGSVRSICHCVTWKDFHNGIKQCVQNVEPNETASNRSRHSILPFSICVSRARARFTDFQFCVCLTRFVSMPCSMTNNKWMLGRCTFRLICKLAFCVWWRTKKAYTSSSKRATNILLSFFSVCSIFHVVFAYEMALRSRVIRTTQPTAMNLFTACSPLFFFGPNQVANGAATSDNERSLFNKRTSSSSFSPQ